MLKRWIRIGLVGLAVLSVAVVTGLSVPAGITITQEGFLSMSSNVALAVGNPPSSEFTERSYSPGNPEIYEYYNTGDDGAWAVYGATWQAQTFTPTTAHKITSVKLKLYRLGSPGTITVSIRATDVDGHPTDADLCSGTTDGNTLGGSPGEWREITLGDGYNLTQDIKYAIVVRAPSGTTTNYLGWRKVNTGTYAGGWLEKSTNSGSTWSSAFSAQDFMFEDWGEEIAAEPEISNTPDSKDFGVVAESATPETGLTFFTVTNNSSGAVSITIQGTDMTGTGTDWDLSDDGSAGTDIYGLKAGLEGGDYTIVVKEAAAYNTLKAGLAKDGTQKWGLKIYIPTTITTTMDEKTGTVTLTATLD